MLTKRHIEWLNAPQKTGKSPLPLVAGGTAVAALGLFAVGLLLLSSAAIGAALAAVALLTGAFILWRRGSGAKAQTIELSYGMIPAATAARFSRIDKAFGVLAASERVWRPRRGEDGSVEREAVEVAVADPPRVSTDVDVWMIDAGGSRIYFLPEGVLVCEDGFYRALSYQAFRVDLFPERVTEEGDVPGDAEVVGRTWRHVAEDGVSPDRTKAFNPQLQQVLYGVLRPRAGAWRGPDLWVSNESAAAQFVLAFLDGIPDPGRVDRWQGARPYEDRGKGDPAYTVLGLEDGAPRNEVTAAYRRIARAYHPDKTARFAPEFRTLANRRMQEINAAYSRLRREVT